MAGTIVQRIALTGGDEILRELEKIGGAIGKEMGDKLVQAANKLKVLSAAGQSLASLRTAFVNIGTNVEKTGESFRRFSQSADLVQRDVGRVAIQFTKLTGIVTGTAFAVGKLAESSASAAEELAHTAASFGVSTDRLQAFQAGFAKAGVSSDALGEALGNIANLSRQYTDEIQKNNEKLGAGLPKAVEQFNDLGVTVRRFGDNVVTTIDGMNRTAADGTRKAVETFDQFGVTVHRFGGDVVDTINGVTQVLKDGLRPPKETFNLDGQTITVRRFGEAVQNLKLQFSDNPFAKVGADLGKLAPGTSTLDQFNAYLAALAKVPDATRRVQLSNETLGKNFTEQFLPAILEGGGALTRLQEIANQGFSKQAVADSQRFMASLRLLQAQLTNTKNAIGSVFTEGGVGAGALDKLGQAVADNTEGLKEFARQIRDFALPLVIDFINEIAGRDDLVAEDSLFKGLNRNVRDFGTGLMAVWRSIIKPAFDGILVASQFVADQLNRMFGTKFTGGALLAAGILLQFLGVFRLLVGTATLVVRGVETVWAALRLGGSIVSGLFTVFRNLATLLGALGEAVFRPLLNGLSLVGRGLGGFGRLLDTLLLAPLRIAGRTVAAFFSGLAEALAPAFANLGTTFRALGGRLLSLITEPFGALASTFRAILGPVGEVVLTTLVNPFKIIGPLLSGIGRIATGAFGLLIRGAVGFLGLLGGLVSWPVLLIAGLVALGVALVAFWPQVKAAALRAINAIVEGAPAVWAALKNLFQQGWDAVKRITSDAYEGLKRIVAAGWAGVVQAARDALAGIEQVAMDAWDGVKNVTAAAYDGIKGAVRDGFEGVKTVVSDSWDGVKEVSRTALEGVKTATSDIWSRIKGVVGDALSGIGKVASDTWDGISSAAQKLGSTIAPIFNTIAETVGSIIRTIVETASGAFTAATDTVTSAAGKIKDAIGTVLDFSKGVGGAADLATAIVKPFDDARARILQIMGELPASLAPVWEQIAGSIAAAFSGIGEKLQAAFAGVGQAIADSLVQPISAAISSLQSQLASLTQSLNAAKSSAADAGSGGGVDTSSGTAVPFASGGHVRGPGSETSDSIPALLSDFEFVHRAKAVRYYGVDLMIALNRLAIPRDVLRRMVGGFRFASGGLVQSARRIGDALPRFANGGLATALAIPSPQLVAALDVGAFGGGGPRHTIDLRTNAGTITVQGTDDTLRQLERASVDAQVKQTGRQPSWKR